MNNKKTIIILILILTIGIVGLTIAYFSNSSSISNTFNTNPYGTTVTEEFVSPDNWLPGTKTDKSLTVTNSGQVDEAVRISYTESWTSKTAKNNNEEGDLPLQQNGNTAALIHFTNTNDWTNVTENGTTYKYYNYKLSPNNTTSELLDYVTFNPAITNSSNCTTNETIGTKTITCNLTGTGYDDATYKLTFNIETVQYDKYKSAWGTSVNIAAMKPMNASELALKSNPITITNYLDGNVHEMYTFNHEATEQTPALTDYRYIGDDPYNYVYFNCDDLNNQNSETCEVWRIIGVFDVERPDPNDNTQMITERRMKLVRGSAFAATMTWDSNNKNDWTNSSLNTYLNVTYLNDISTPSKTMIEDTKYYLGGRKWGLNAPYYGTTDEIYLWERGNKVLDPNESYLFGCGHSSTKPECNSWPIDWIGVIALLYPSDEFLTYANNVENNCYADPHNCYIGNGINPNTSWILNSNKLESESQLTQVWLLSHINESAETIFFISESGGLNTNSINGLRGIRPVLYLSSSVKIIDGDGSINNPYKLSNS